MIRREFQTTDGRRSWLLISQIEHARLAALLAQHWATADLRSYDRSDGFAKDAISEEVLTAIARHDDGWAEWENEPSIDPQHGRPYSFMNELPLNESISIWDRSIEVARDVGLLAGWMVASHFYDLLKSGSHEDDNRAASWLKSIDSRRRDWLRQWQESNAQHSMEVAERALRLLQTCDFLSLWLCCECPVAANEMVSGVAPFQMAWPDAVYDFTAERTAGELSQIADPFANSGWLVSGVPWPFDKAELRLSIEASLAPARPYDTSRALLDCMRPLRLRWQLH